MSSPSSHDFFKALPNYLPGPVHMESQPRPMSYHPARVACGREERVGVARARWNPRAAAHRSPTPTTNTKPKSPLRLRDRTNPPQPPRRHSREATAAIGLATPALHDAARFHRRWAYHRRWVPPPWGASCFFSRIRTSSHIIVLEERVYNTIQEFRSRPLVFVHATL